MEKRKFSRRNLQSFIGLMFKIAHLSFGHIKQGEKLTIGMDFERYLH